MVIALLTKTLAYEFLYNNEGDLYALRNRKTNRVSFFEYDHAGRCMACTERTFTVSGGQVVLGSVVSGYKYEYDPNNNLTKLTCNAAGGSWETVYTYDKDNRTVTATFANGKVLTVTYDAIGRVTKRRLGLTSNYDTDLTYVPGYDGSQTALLSTYQNGSDDAYEYAYDDNGNITSITRGSTAVTYQYNGANELIRENNGFTNQTVIYTYDSWGNITEKKIYAYTTAENPGTPTQTIPYTYSTGDWKDQLVSYDGQSIAYDGMGNPTTYRGKALTWDGKELTGVVGTASYTYDLNGLRTTKTVNNVTTDYFYNNTVLMGLTDSNNNTLLFSYDASGQVQAVRYNGTYYYYLRNGQGDIVKLIDGSGNTVVEYTYDSWGKPLNCTGTLATSLGKLNPFRYRGYVYDEETGFYYLKSRYYDPETCRFISADVLLSTGQGVLGHNCYAYCLNSPIYYSDPYGTCTRFLGLIIRDCGKSNCPYSKNYSPPERYVQEKSKKATCLGYALEYIYQARGKPISDKELEKTWSHHGEGFTAQDIENWFISLVDSIDGAKAEKITDFMYRYYEEDEIVVAAFVPKSGSDYHFMVYVGELQWADKSRNAWSRFGFRSPDDEQYKGEYIYFLVKVVNINAPIQ